MLSASSFSATLPALASKDKPGEGITVRPARATWTTGYFQEAIVHKGLEALGYTVDKPKDLANPIFYQAVTQGDVDYWANGWLPLHQAQMPKNFDEHAEAIGYVAKNGGLQGYLVDKADVDKYHIQSLDDFKRPEVRNAFDENGDGKADLIACPPGWGCEKVIKHHMKVYGLENDIKPIKAAYAASMAQGLASFNAGKPVFFYTWTPNWTTAKLVPGKDVMWINVPQIEPTDAQKDFADAMTASGIQGAVSDPVKLGFVVNDIRIVANKKFLADNPAAKKFFEEFTMSLDDINAQNAKMQAGEKSQRDIARQADEWISDHQMEWNAWLEAARAAAQ